MKTLRKHTGETERSELLDNLLKKDWLLVACLFGGKGSIPLTSPIPTTFSFRLFKIDSYDVYPTYIH